MMEEPTMTNMPQASPLYAI